MITINHNDDKNSIVFCLEGLAFGIPSSKYIQSIYCLTAMTAREYELTTMMIRQSGILSFKTLMRGSYFCHYPIFYHPPLPP
jgi:hypothetical protein